MSLSPGRRLLFGVVTAIAGLAFVLLAGEVMARLAGYRMPGVYDASGALVVPDPVDADGGPFRGVDGALYHFDFEVSWRNNADGFREREPVPKAPGEWRIGLLGDSFAAGYGLEVHERLADQWFEEARERMPGATLWNLGANDTGTQHQADLLAGVGSDYALDEIILLYYSGNEGKDDLRWEKQREREQSRKGEAPAAKAKKARRSPLRTLLRQSRLAMLAWTFVGAQLAQGVSRVDAPLVDGLERFDAPTLRGLERFRAAVGDRPLTLWYMPSRMEWDDEHWSFMKAQQGLADDSQRFVLRRAVEAWAAQAGVPFVDLTPALLHQPADEVRFRIDGHYTAAATRRMARLLADDDRAAARLREQPGG